MSFELCVEDPNPQYWADGLLWPWTGDSPEYMSHKWRKWVPLENFVSAVQMAKGSRKYYWFMISGIMCCQSFNKDNKITYESHEWIIANMFTWRLNADFIGQTNCSMTNAMWSYIFVSASMPTEMSISLCFQKEEGENWNKGKTCIPTVWKLLLSENDKNCLISWENGHCNLLI